MISLKSSEKSKLIHLIFSEKKILSDKKLDFTVLDATRSKSIDLMIEFKDKVDVFIGFEDSCYFEGIFASSLSLPLITYVFIFQLNKF